MRNFKTKKHFSDLKAPMLSPSSNCYSALNGAGGEEAVGSKINLSKACTTILIPLYLFVNVSWEQALKSFGGKNQGEEGGKEGRGAKRK